MRDIYLQDQDDQSPPIFITHNGKSDADVMRRALYAVSAKEGWHVTESRSLVTPPRIAKLHLMRDKLVLHCELEGHPRDASITRLLPNLGSPGAATVWLQWLAVLADEDEDEPAKELLGALSRLLDSFIEEM